MRRFLSSPLGGEDKGEGLCSKSPAICNPRNCGLEEESRFRLSLLADAFDAENDKQHRANLAFESVTHVPGPYREGAIGLVIERRSP